MQPKHEDSKFKEWLDTLQQESWQLELIISGVAIFGLLQAVEPFLGLMTSIKDKLEGEVFLSIVSVISFSAILISLICLIICLIVHVVLRGLWIGAVGLRYFSGDIDYDILGYTDRFKEYLQKRIGSFDRYIAKLEDYCSLIFALSFLLVFFFLSFFITLIVFLGIAFVTRSLFGENIWEYTRLAYLVFTCIFLVTTAVDFFSQGFLKKKKWLALVYFPIYRVMSKITLSFLYRPLLYNLLDNKLGKRILALLVPIFIIGLVLLSITIKQSNYHISRWVNSKEYAKSSNYYDLIENREEIFVESATIPSKIIETTSLPVFIKHKASMENAVYKIDTTLNPIDDDRGLILSAFRARDDSNSDTIAYTNFQKYMSLLSDIYMIKIDSIVIPTEYIAGVNKKQQLGYETVLDLEALSRGHHTLHIKGKVIRKDSLITIDIAKIPFWYYPN